MGFFRSFLSRFSVLRELMVFLWKRKLWWMIPMVIILVIFGLLLIFSQSSVVAPFIYTIF